MYISLGEQQPISQDRQRTASSQYIRFFKIIASVDQHVSQSGGVGRDQLDLVEEVTEPDQAGVGRFFEPSTVVRTIQLGNYFSKVAGEEGCTLDVLDSM